MKSLMVVGAEEVEEESDNFQLQAGRMTPSTQSIYEVEQPLKGAVSTTFAPVAMSTSRQ